MMVAAKILAGPFDKISNEDLNTILEHGNVAGGFICGVRWADKNPETPWVDANKRLPEDSLPHLSNKDLERQSIKVMVRMMNGSVLEANRRISLDGVWYWNIPVRMRDHITHWMPVPSVMFKRTED